MAAKFSRASRQRLRVITVGITLLLILWVLFSPFGVFRHLKARQRLAAVELEIEALERENQELAEINNRLENDDEYLEQIARKRYGMIRENEIIFDFSRNGR